MWGVKSVKKGCEKNKRSVNRECDKRPRRRRGFLLVRNLQKSL